MCSKKIRSVSALQKPSEEDRISNKRRHQLQDLPRGQDLTPEREGILQKGGQARGQEATAVNLMSKQGYLQHGLRLALEMRAGGDEVQTVLVAALHLQFPLELGRLRGKRPVPKPTFLTDPVPLMSITPDLWYLRSLEAIPIHQYHVELIIYTSCQLQNNTWKLRHRRMSLFKLPQLILQLLLALLGLQINLRCRS